MTNENLEREERDWIAFQYVAGELSAEEASEFESRLAYDSSVCEAVVRAVELVEVTALAESQAARCTHSQNTGLQLAATASEVWGWRTAWMACGAAACLALVLLRPVTPLRIASSEDWSSPGAPSFASISPELAKKWAETRDRRDFTDIVDLSDASTSQLLEEAIPSDDQISTPTWMLTAVQGLSLTSEGVE